MLQGPESLNSVEDSANRRDTVLQVWLQQDILVKAKKPKLQVDIFCAISEGKNLRLPIYPSYFDALVNEAVSKYNLTEEEELSIMATAFTQSWTKTTKQNELFVKTHPSLSPDERMERLLNPGDLALEPKTGGVH